jgi:superfamily I DNA and/or RNA helicase
LFERVTGNKEITMMLDTQYRMHHTIMGFSNKQFYDSGLVAHKSVRDAVLSKNAEKLFLNKAVEFVDTAGCGFEEILNPESLSIYNPEEGNLLFKHLMMLYSELQEERNITSVKIGIISPYKEQVEHLRQQVESAEDLSHIKNNIVVKTIDGFQGQEKDIIYISMVRSNNMADIGFLSDTRRMNVALTRAKRKLVVVGDSATLANHKFYKNFLNYIEEIGAYRSAWELI